MGEAFCMIFCRAKSARGEDLDDASADDSKAVMASNIETIGIGEGTSYSKAQRVEGLIEVLVVTS